MRKLILATAIPVLLSMTWAVPLPGASSLTAGASDQTLQTIGPRYHPLHKGGVSLASGLYFRENEDLVVPGSPGLVLRRTYLSEYRASKQFGVGTTHTGEEYLIGDGEGFQWAALILARGTRINFKRTSPGRLLLNAVYVHDEYPEWRGAELRWSLLAWTLRKPDGTVLTFRGCGPGSVCSIIRATAPDGRAIEYKRDAKGTLTRMESGDRWIAFDYDDRGRISRAYASTTQDVRYVYDDRGRLTSATSSTGAVRRYGYTDFDQLATIEEPGTSIENTYDHGRCVLQVNRYPDGPPLVFEFKYSVVGQQITSTESFRSDGKYERFTWDEQRLATSHAVGPVGQDPIVFTYQRDATTRALTGLTVNCAGPWAGRVPRTAPVTAGTEDAVKGELIAYCAGISPDRR